MVNNSKKKIEITLDVDDQIDHLKKNFVSIAPSGNIVINPKEKHDLEVAFKPTARINTFKS